MEQAFSKRVGAGLKTIQPEERSVRSGRYRPIIKSAAAAVEKFAAV